MKAELFKDAKHTIVPHERFDVVRDILYKHNLIFCIKLSVEVSMTNSNSMPTWLGPSLAGAIIALSFGYLFITRNRLTKIQRADTSWYADEPD
ncbi:MAG TPA: hypothetical protein VEL11_11400 [Candidatus Bathyarchaeia archaeon]|nr:hypothetical protein [Candidatus Bathyarchaeia archaeon]